MSAEPRSSHLNTPIVIEERGEVRSGGCLWSLRAWVVSLIVVAWSCGEPTREPSRTVKLSYPLLDAAVDVELQVTVPEHVELAASEYSPHWSFHAAKEYFGVELLTSEQRELGCTSGLETFVVPTTFGIHRRCKHSIGSTHRVGDVRVRCRGEWKPGEASFDWMWAACLGMQVRVRPMTYAPSTWLEEVIEDKGQRWRVRVQVPEYFRSLYSKRQTHLSLLRHPSQPMIHIYVFDPAKNYPAQWRCSASGQKTVEYVEAATGLLETCVDEDGEAVLRHESRRGAHHVRCMVRARELRLLGEIRKVCDTVSVESLP